MKVFALIRSATLAVVLIAALALSGCPRVAPSTAKGDHWIRLAHLTDVHIVDEESPGRAVLMDGFVAASFRPQEAYAVQVLDATIREINRHHYEGIASGKGPIDFVVVSGDVTDNMQLNEWQWFIDTMDGKVVTPDSGALDGPLRTDVPPALNPNLPVQTQGLAWEIPWYVNLGNHDVTCLGNFYIDRSSADPVQWTAPQVGIVAGLMGLTAMNPPRSALWPTDSESPAALTADTEFVDPNNLQLLTDQIGPGPVPADPDRHFVSNEIVIKACMKSNSLPKGHGFSGLAGLMGQTYYAFKPDKEVPIRVIVMDTGGQAPLPGVVDSSGSITVTQWETFIKPEIKDAQANDEYCILVSHHPHNKLDRPVAAPVITGEQFTSYLTTQPNILLHLCGHEHWHHVEKIEGKHPYIEITTASLADYPQEGRILDIYYDRVEHVFTIESTLVRHMDNPTTLSKESYRRASIDLQVDPDSYHFTEMVGGWHPIFESYSVKDAKMLASYLEDDTFKGMSDAEIAAKFKPLEGLEKQRPKSRTAMKGRSEDQEFSIRLQK